VAASDQMSSGGVAGPLSNRQQGSGASDLSGGSPLQTT
jgi:hypothetical protein